MTEEGETEQLIPDPMTMGETGESITVCPEMDFSLVHQVGEDHEMQEEVIVKTEIDDSGKAVLPPIPFSFPGQTFDTKCQKLILNVWDFFKRVKKNPDIMDEIRTPQERAAAALHISAATIGKIGKNLKRTGKLETPGKKRKRTRPIVDSVGHTDEDVIRQIIQEMRSSKMTPTLPMVLAEARARINFSGGATSFRRILQRMGYKNLSQKNTNMKSKMDSIMSSPMTVKMIKKEPGTSTFNGCKLVSNNHNVNMSHVTLSNNTVVPVSSINSLPVSIVSATSPPSTAVSTASSTAVQTLHQHHQSGQMLHLGATGGSEPLTISQQTAAAIANAAQANGTQTLHISDGHTIRQIQIVYASMQ